MYAIRSYYDRHARPCRLHGRGRTEPAGPWWRRRRIQCPRRCRGVITSYSIHYTKLYEYGTLTKYFKTHQWNNDSAPVGKQWSDKKMVGNFSLEKWNPLNNDTHSYPEKYLKEDFMLQIGFVGWRGMVGSVLMGRMREAEDFKGFEPTFFVITSYSIHYTKLYDREGFHTAQSRETKTTMAFWNEKLSVEKVQTHGRPPGIHKGI